jgi:Holliday junction resolvase RusA-like endonuclease
MDAQCNPPQVAFTVPYLTPPSVNHYKRPTQRRDKDGKLRLWFQLTKEAHAYRDAVAIFARGESVAPRTDHERSKVKYAVHAKVYLGKRQRLDADNAGKVLLDALENCGVIHSDAFVQDSRIEIIKDQRDNPRTEVEVTRL